MLHKAKKLPGWVAFSLTLLGLALVTVGPGVMLPLPKVANALIDHPPPPSATSTGRPLRFDGEAAYQHVLAQVELGPRPTGSAAGWATGDFILAELKKAGWPTETQPFIFKGVRGRNIIGRLGQGPVFIIGAHYDTRPAADREPDPQRRRAWILGANDGASGVAVLLELARVLEPAQLNNEIWLVFFDAEDRGFLDGWPYAVGSRYLAQNLTTVPQQVIIVDMVGDADQQLYFEQYSTPALQTEIWAVAARLGYGRHFIPQAGYAVIDDHIPFLERAIPAVDIIDFDYPYWHTLADTPDKVAPQSLERVGRTLEAWVQEKP